MGCIIGSNLQFENFPNTNESNEHTNVNLSSDTVGATVLAIMPLVAGWQLKHQTLSNHNRSYHSTIVYIRFIIVSSRSTIAAHSSQNVHRCMLVKSLNKGDNKKGR